MQDFPPRIATFFTGTSDAPTPDPDTRSPAAFLRWMLRQQWQVIALASLACLLWLMPLTFGPYIFGRAVDDGILGGSTADLLTWVGRDARAWSWSAASSASSSTRWSCGAGSSASTAPPRW